MIPLDLSTNLGVGIYDPIGSQIQILGIGSRDPFLGSMDMSDGYHIASVPVMARGACQTWGSLDDPKNTLPQ